MGNRNDGEFLLGIAHNLCQPTNISLWLVLGTYYSGIIIHPPFFSSNFLFSTIFILILSTNLQTLPLKYKILENALS